MNDKVKLIGGIVVLVVAALLILWNLGVFSPGPAATAPVPPPDRPAPVGGARTAPGVNPG